MLARPQATVSFTLLAVLSIVAPAFADKDVEIFNGKDFSGWTKRGGEATYRIEDGVIIGRSAPNTTNTFMTTDKEFGDFILEMDFKIDSKDKFNSGIQIRSHSRPEKVKGKDEEQQRVFGYQVEIDSDPARPWTAGLYFEGGSKDRNADKKVFSISGQGWTGKAATPDYFRKLDVTLIPGDGFLPATVPAAFGSWAFALLRFGTLSLKDVLEPTIDYATSGFPIYAGLRNSIAGLAKRFRDEWPASAALYLPDNRVPAVGDLHTNPEWANVLKKAVVAEMKAAKHGRADAIQAAIDFWYKGEIADQIVAFMTKTAVRDASKRSHKGFLTKEDFAAWKPTLEPPVSVDYRGLTVFKCGPWTQGPVFLQQLRLLEGFDLQKLGHNSASYIHTVIEAAKLAFADREKFYGDPAQVKVPLDRLLSKDYADERRKLIERKASLEMRPGQVAAEAPGAVNELFPKRDNEESHDHDTTHTCAIDARGNMMAATCSGGWIPSSPVIPGLGFPMGTRGQMFDLDPHRAGVIAPRKRPRTTLTPSLVLRGDKPYMVFGTPGGDQQDQWTLQFFLNFVDFGMNLQEAIDAPTFHTTHFPSSFYPRKATAGGLVVEGRISETTQKELAARGHKVKATGPWANGLVMAAYFGPRPGTLSAGVSPRGEIGYVTGE